MITKMLKLILTASVCCFILAADSCKEEQAKTKEVSAKESLTLSCKTDADCKAVNDGCCGCQQGGKRIAIRAQDEKAWVTEATANCSQTVCPMVMSKDPSCQQKPVCEAGSCRLK